MFLPDYQTRIVDRLFDNPNLFVTMFEDEKDAALVVPMTRESYSRSVFLDWRTERSAPAAELVPIKIFEQALRARDLPQRPLRFIFHSAFAGVDRRSNGPAGYSGVLAGARPARKLKRSAALRSVP